MPRELAACVERADLDPEVHVIALAGNGSGFCGGYDLVASAEQMPPRTNPPRPRLRLAGVRGEGRVPGSPLDPAVIAQNHDPRRHVGPGRRLPDDVAQRARVHEPVLVRQAGDLQGARLLRRRRHRHGAVLGPARGRGPSEDRLPAGAGLGRADDGAVGAPDRRRPRQAAAADRRLDLRRAGGRVGPRRRGGARRPSSTQRFEALLERVARLPVNQLVMHKLLVNQAVAAQGLTQPRSLGTFFDGIARHTAEGFDFAAPRGRVGLQAGGARARRAVRRLRPRAPQLSRSRLDPCRRRPTATAWSASAAAMPSESMRTSTGSSRGPRRSSGEARR